MTGSVCAVPLVVGAALGLGFSGVSVPVFERLQFTQQLATLLGAGQPLDRALGILLELPENPEARRVIERIREAVRGGAPLSTALEQQHGIFSRLYVNLVRAGEAGGSLQESLRRLADYLERSAALRGRVDTIAAAIEARDAAAMQRHLATDFIGNDGLDREGARRLAMGYVLRYRDLGVSLGPLEVEMAPAHATVRCKAVLRGGSGRALPDSARIYDVESGWRMEDGEWKLASVRWTPVL